MQGHAWTFGDLARATIVNHASFAINVVITLLLTPLVFDRLGASDYGLWILVLSQVSLLGLLDFDLHDSVVRSVSSARASGETGRLPATIANALLLAIGISAVGAIVVALLSRYLLTDLYAGADQAEVVRALVAAGLVFFCCEQLSSIPEGVLLGGKRFVASEIVGVAAAISNAVLTALILLSGGGLVELAVVTAINAVVWTGVTFLVARRRVPDLPIGVRHASRDRETWRPLLSFFAWSTIIGLAMTAIHDTDTILLGALVSASAIAMFELALKVPLALWSITETTFWGVFPYSADLQGRKRPDLLQRTFTLGTRMATVLSAFFLVAFWFVGPLALEWWVGPITDGTTLLRLGLAVNVIYGAFLVAESLLYGCGQQRSLAAIYGLGSVLGVPLLAGCIALWGATGAVLGTVPMGGLFLAGMLFRTSRFVDLPVRRVVGDTLLRPLLPLIPAMALMLAVDAVASHEALGRIGTSLIGIVAFVAAAAFLTFTAAEREAGRHYALSWLEARESLWNGRLRRAAR
jgi:O-antigen/teichoic acid export membrane protein